MLIRDAALALVFFPRAFHAALSQAATSDACPALFSSCLARAPLFTPFQNLLDSITISCVVPSVRRTRPGCAETRVTHREILARPIYTHAPQPIFSSHETALPARTPLGPCFDEPR